MVLYISRVFKHSERNLGLKKDFVELYFMGELLGIYPKFYNVLYQLRIEKFINI